ncbi:MAG: type II secretion system F family protein [Patescibacteria group bacterium]|nr:type II secretion system F family protein [Patescibacteria group bacterium]MDE2015839.1 type II secretion system F family protein [Patescibacteria group bacterium]MDE2227214.1 type II secretion system F family protein [Patescibacteria group bacterium]
MSNSPILFRRLFHTVSIQDKINFARHLSIVIKAGLPILEGLKMIRKQTSSRYLASIIDKISTDVSNGQFLANSLANFSDVFDKFFVNIVRVGETSGTLATNLSYLSDELKKSNDLKNKIRSAMIYPIIVMMATVALTSFLVFFAFPKILPIFTGLHVQLPITTRILIATSEFLIANGVYLIVGIIIFFIGIKLLFLVRPVHYLFDRLLLFLPVFSPLIVDVNMANFTRILAVLLRGGIKIVEAVNITADTFGNLVYQSSLNKAASEIKKGEQLAQYLSVHKAIFPMLLSGLIEIGENTGNLEDNLSYLADYYREEAELKIQNLTALIEPLLLLLMGLIVGFVAVSIITPIYTITQGVS